MGTMSPRNLKYFHILVIVVLATVSVSSSAETCQQGCATPNKLGKLKLSPGNFYTYKLDSIVTVYLSGKDAQETQLKVEGVVQVHARTECDYLLKIQRLTVLGPDGKKNEIGSTVAAPVGFSMSNDELVSELCADEKETEFALNLKRGIISLLQSADSKTFETDVFGTCPTSFSTIKNGDSVIVTKVRNLNACGHRETLANGFITGIVNENSGVKSTPLLNGDYSNEQRYSASGVLESVQLHEEYRYVPFSSGDAGARAKVITKLILTGKPGNSQLKHNCKVPRTLLFENPHVDPISNINSLKTALKNVLTTYENNVGAKAAGQFTELIRLMRFTKKDDLLALYQQIKSGTATGDKVLSRKIYLDALVRAGTGDSIEVSASLLKGREINESEQRLIYLSFNLVDSVTKEAVIAVNKLLDIDPPKEAYLSIGNLVSKFCKQNGCESNEIKSISEKFVAKLDGCKGAPDTVVAVLKGIGNTDNLVAPAIDKVLQCTGDKFPNRIRVAALQATAAAACNQKIQDNLLRILGTRTEDSELRIEAYLALVSCPTATVANEIKKLLDEETVAQVGSFITSHLANIRASTDPYREVARKQLGLIRTSNKFPSDFRRYSFNREFSYALESLGVGASVDTNVIYSQKSFIPRSGSFNFTGGLFGNSFNVFEFNGRQENLEGLVEHYFGPKGVFTNLNTQELYNLFAENYNTLSTETGNRFRRGLREDLTAFATKSIKGLNDVNSEVELDLSYKMFGNELYFLSLGDCLPTNPKEFIDTFLKYLDKAINNAKGFEYKFEHHSLFMDANLVYPTGVGFPLKLSATGSAVVNFQTSGSIDLKAIARDIKNTNFSFKVVPSSSIEVAGVLSVDGYAVSTGLEVTISAHSSTGTDVTFAFTGNGFDVKLNMPVAKQELFGFEHKINFITQERGLETVAVPLKFAGREPTKHFCFDQSYQLIGATFCTNFAFTTVSAVGGAPFPLSGPNKLSVWIEVDKQFHISAAHNIQSQTEQSLVFTFDTPGSQNPRKTTVKYEIAMQPTIFARASIDSPFRSASIEGGFQNDDKEISLYVKALNQDDLYLAKLGLQKGGGGGGGSQEYTPIVIIQTPAKKEDNLYGYKVTGKVIAEPNGKYHFKDIQLLDATQDPVKLNGWFLLDVANTKVAADMEFDKRGKIVKLKGQIEYKPQNLILDIGATNNYNQFGNGRIIYELAFSKNNAATNVKNDFTLVYGNDLESPTQRIELYQDATFSQELNHLVELKLTLKAKAPFLPASLTLDSEYDKNLVKYNLEVQYARNKIVSDLLGHFNKKAPGDYNIAFGLGVNNHNLKYTGKHDIADSKSLFTNKIESSTGANVELNGHVGHGMTAENIDISVNGNLVPGANQEPFTVSFVAAATVKEANSNGKLLAGSTELLSYEFKLTRGDNQNGKFELNIKDLLTSKSNFKSKNLAGDASVLINFKKFARKVKIDTKFNVAAPVYDVSTDVLYDFEKDNTKKIHFDTTSHVTSDSIKSKNNLEIFSEKYQFNIEGDKKNSAAEQLFNGKGSVVLSTGRSIAFSVNRQINLKGDDATCHLNVKLEDTLPNRKSRSLELKGDLTDGNYKASLFNVIYVLTYRDLDNGGASAKVVFKHLPKDTYRTALASIYVEGSLIPEPVKFVFNVEEYCSKHAVYSATTKFGNKFDFTASGNYYLGARAKPYTYQITTAFNLPTANNEYLKKGSLESSGSFLVPETEGGVFATEFKLATQLNENKVIAEVKAKGNINHGTGSFNVKLPDIDAVTGEGSFSHEENEGTNKYHGTGEIKYGKSGETVKGNLDVSTTGKNDLSLHAFLSTPLSRAKDIDFTFKTAKSNENTYTSNAHLTTDGKNFGYNSVFVFSDTHPEIDLTLTYPSQTSKIYAGSSRLGDRKYKAKVIIENLGDFSFAGSTEVNFQSVDNFYFKGAADSAKLSLNKFSCEIEAKQGSGGKRVEFKASNNDKSFLSGYADYNVKEEKGKTIIEGQGNVKWYDTPKTANFKFIRTDFEEKRDGETGYLFVFDGSLGVKNIVSEFKVTNKNFKVKNTACEEKKQCINFEIRSLTSRAEFDEFFNEFLISVDLRELGLTHEFGLKAETKRSGFKLDHTLDMHLQSNDQSKYEYNFYIHPKSAGSALTLPTRTMSVEAVYQIPAEYFGKYEYSVSLYTDKTKNPQNAASVGFSGEVQRTGSNGISSHGELKLAHPTIRPLRLYGTANLDGDRQSASGKLEFDIFKSADQKILVAAQYANTDKTIRGFNVTSDVSVSSRGLRFEYGVNGHAALSAEKRQLSVAGSVTSPNADLKTTLYFFGSEEAFEMQVYAFNEEIVSANGKFDWNKQNAFLRSTTKWLGSTPIVTDFKMVGFTSATFNLKRGNLLQVDGEFTTGKLASLTFKGAQKELFKGKILLTPGQFLSSEYKVNDADIKDFLQQARQEISAEREKIKSELMNRYQKLVAFNSEQLATLKASIPDFAALQQTYQTELEHIGSELLSDPTIQQFVAIFNKLYGALAEKLTGIIEVIKVGLQKTYNELAAFYTIVQEHFTNEIWPAIQYTLTQVEHILVQLYDESIVSISNLLERTLKALKSFEDDFNKIAKTVSDNFKVVATTVSKYFDIVRKELIELYKWLSDQVNNLPGLDSLKEKWNELVAKLTIPEHVIRSIRELVSTTKDTLTPEIGQFLDELIKYIESKLTNQNVNDIESLKNIFVTFTQAIRSLYGLLLAHSGDAQVSAFYVPLPITFEFFKNLPYITSVKFSPFNYLANEKFESIPDLWYTYRPYAFSPLEFFPPFKMRAHIIDGEHLFTFDGQHIRWPGACTYILAQDFVHGNFSLVANIQGGKLKSLTLLDKGDIVEITDQGTVTLNGKPTDLPVHKDSIHAWRRFYSISALSTYGVNVLCTTDLKVCHITVSGFYLGRLRGLLGNGNSESSDDFTLPNGKITENIADFGNAYKTTAKCTKVGAAEQTGGSTTECANLFSSDSSMRLGFLAVRPTIYREACESAVATSQDKQAAACAIALAYASACRLENIPVNVPDSCVKCPTAAAVGDSFAVQVPQKKADIVFVVDTGLETLLNDFVQPTIANLRNELKNRQVTDADIAVIGYNANEKYMTHFTPVDGKFSDFSGKFPDKKGPTEEKSLVTGYTPVDAFFKLLHSLCERTKEDVGLSADAVAFRDAVKYPFRADAAKVIIAVRGDTLKYSSNPLKSLGAIASSKVVQQMGIQVHLVAPIEELSLTTKDQRKLKELVGFSSRLAWITADAKKKGNFGSADLRNNLKYGSDLGVDIVQRTDGIAYALQNFIALDKNPRKFFITTVAATVADRVARTEIKSECKCQLSYGLYAEEKCEMKETKQITPASRKADARG